MSLHDVLPELRQTAALMGTTVTIHVVGAEADEARKASIARAFEWFRRVEECCTRFDRRSELMRLTERVGEAVSVTPLLFEAVRFALEVARASDGAFDPTVGHLQEKRGFNRHYLTGDTVNSNLGPDYAEDSSGNLASYRSVRLNKARRTITLLRPLVLDLGAVAKGFAVDLAARELAAFAGAAVDAGGDVYARGVSSSGGPWRIGIRHPRSPGQLIDIVVVSNSAVCTSGDYECPAAESDAGHHIIDPRTGNSPDAFASLTVIAPTAMAADALGTAAFVLGPSRGLTFLGEQGINGVGITRTLQSVETPGFSRYRQ